MRSAAFNRAERTRRRSRPATARQTRTLAGLCKTAGIEMPVCRWSHQASDAIDRVLKAIREPTLELRWDLPGEKGTH